MTKLLPLLWNRPTHATLSSGNFFNQSDYTNEFYVILNLALGGSMGGSIDNDIFASEILMKVDWVRIYQKQFIE